jgi:hypothetical protein
MAPQRNQDKARHDRNTGRGTTKMDQETERSLADEGDATDTREAASNTDRDMQSGGRTSTGSVNKRSEGTDHGSSSKH